MMVGGAAVSVGVALMGVAVVTVGAATEDGAQVWCSPLCLPILSNGVDVAVSHAELFGRSSYWPLLTSSLKG